MKVAVVGGGAAGFFAALSVRAHHSGASVTLFEKSSKVLAKVKVSGGGRCNVTTAITAMADLVSNYPRGGRLLKGLFHQFQQKDTVAWFAKRGVELKTEPDGRMFPQTNTSQTIIDCFEAEAQKAEIKIQLNAWVKAVNQVDGCIELNVNDELLRFDRVIITTGGSPNPEGLKWLADLGHTIERPVPSLFTLNLPHDPITSLMGVSSNEAVVRLAGTKFAERGAVLVTHWGLSGPAVLRLSAFAARWLNEHNYEAQVLVNWSGIEKEDELRAVLKDHFHQFQNAFLGSKNPFGLPTRLWAYLIDRAELHPETYNREVGGKAFNKLVNEVMNNPHIMHGKTTFKEEFVTCGGVSAQSVNANTLQSRHVPGLYFAGEVLDVDGVTGGFNFQAAWTTGFVAGKLG